jgi:uncharacterized protein YjiS (DUF1127 family)
LARFEDNTMTTATLPHLSTPAARPNSAFRFLADLVSGVMEAREIEQRYHQLTRLSNAELARLGLTRQDIPRAAVFGRAGI